MSIKNYYDKQQIIKDTATNFTELLDYIEELRKFHMYKNHSIQEIEIEMKINYLASEMYK